MLSDAIQKAINEQIKHEFSSAYAYLGMSAYFETINLPGFAAWMRAQFREEIAHGMRLFDFVHARGGVVKLHAIEEPAAGFKSPLDVVQRALAQERRVSSLIHGLYELAHEEKDYPTQVELQWFVTEQIEEEKTFSDLVEQLKLAGDDGGALLMLNQQLGQRPEEGAD